MDGALAAGAPPGVRRRVRIDGTVQGVGFRPFVFRLAGELDLAGWVRNDEHGVEVEVEGGLAGVEEFIARVSREAPPLARVESVRSEPLPLGGDRTFLIAASAHGGEADAAVLPDAATCADCLAELTDPADRRFRYPFINCTNCGPRFTIVRGVPYDRPLTTMAGFQMCERCRGEYEDPGDRRFHAQPNACPDCGPRARLVVAGESPAGGDGMDAPAATALLLSRGAIVAVKGLGGYHLACRADDERAVAELRARKRREERPFALMVADLEAARRLVVLGSQEEAMLLDHARPIVLAPRRRGASVAAAVAPGVGELGLMLPYSPLHHLLLADLRDLGHGVLVMTSANTSDEPIAYEDRDALERLSGIADAFLVHDRPIHTRTDDSVVRAVRTGGRRSRMLIRRSRGHVPASLPLPLPSPRPLLACGAELKSTFCLARGERAWVGHHIGDLRNWETLRSFREGIAHFEELFAVRPEAIVHDMHPDYLSSGYALERDSPVTVAVQHHHAHMAAVLAEHGERGPAVGAIYDGTGYGTDGTVWGGELLVGGLDGFRRAGHLWPVRMPGGERAIREPWRMAFAWLAETAGETVPTLPPTLAGRVEPERWSIMGRVASAQVAAPVTTSVGRLCDAMAALCGLRSEVAYEGQAAIELEAIASPGERGSYPLPYEDGRLDPRPAVSGVLADLAGGLSAATVSARFHNGLADATAQACLRIARESALELAVLAGGVFQNRLLLERTAAALEGEGLRVLVPERLPPNDGAISYGQAAVAARALTDMRPG